MYKINILVASYNQQNVISRAIDSVLIQSDYGLNKIVIVDDCSSDRTWDVIMQYSNKYSDLIEAYRNEKNLGIYGNFQKLVSLKGNADFYSFLAGDDSYCNGWFEKIQECLNINHVNSEESIGIYGDWKSHNIKGVESINKQDVVLTKVSPISLFIRGLISDRSNMISRGLISRFGKIDLNQGLNLAEALFDAQTHMFADRIYYIPYVGSIYYTQIGISTKLGDEYWVEGELIKWSYFKKSILTKRSDKSFSNYKINKILFSKSRSIRFFLKSLFYRFLAINVRIGRIRPFARDLYSLFRLIKSK